MNTANTPASWANFNDAPEQTAYDILPKGTLVKVRMTFKPGGFDSPEHGWTGGYATRNPDTGSIYLNAEFVVTEGEYARRKIWSLIGLYSPRSTEWATMGRAFVRALLNSARGLHPQDASPQAQAGRCIHSFADLDGIEFLAKIDIDQDQHGQPKNVIKVAIQPDHKEYARLMGAALAVPAASGIPLAQANPPNAPPALTPAAQSSGLPGRPSWA